MVQPTDARQCDFNREGDLFLYLFGGKGRIDRIDLDLVVGDVGYGIDAVAQLLVLAALTACTAGGEAAERAPGLPAERWLIVDQDADPGRFGGHPGCIFEVDPVTRELRVFATSADWQDPSDLLEIDDGLLLLDYAGEGGVGRLFLLSRDGVQQEEIHVPEGLVDCCCSVPGRSASPRQST